LNDKKKKQKEETAVSISGDIVVDIDTIAYNSNALILNPFIVKKSKKLNRI